jgi:hypothetical protein
MLRMCGALLPPLWHVTWAQGIHFSVLLILWKGGGSVKLVWQQFSMMAEEAVVIHHEALSAKFIQIIIHRLLFGHTLSRSLH